MGIAVALHVVTNLSGFKSTMILTTCWVCAAPLDQNWLGKCVRCDTRYCSQACLRQHPDEECRSITRGGGAAQYHADKKYKEAVAVAVEKCAEDTCRTIWRTRMQLLDGTKRP